MNRFTLQGFKSEAIHETGLSGYVVASFFPLIIFIYIYIYIYTHSEDELTVVFDHQLADGKTFVTFKAAHRVPVCFMS